MPACNTVEVWSKTPILDSQGCGSGTHCGELPEACPAAGSGIETRGAAMRLPQHPAAGHVAGAGRDGHTYRGGRNRVTIQSHAQEIHACQNLQVGV
jgi:hypothetical protein